MYSINELHSGVTRTAEASPNPFEGLGILESPFLAGCQVDGAFFYILHDGFLHNLPLETAECLFDGFV